MGAWGHESFENDDALDLVAELEESDDYYVIMDVLIGVADNPEDDLEAPQCSMAIAAAEIVAALSGKPPEAMPEDVANWLEEQPKPSAALIAKARRAVDAVLGDSELHELWKDNEEDYPKWLAAVQDLRSRLA